jgi:hypothetical protein
MDVCDFIIRCLACLRGHLQPAGANGLVLVIIIIIIKQYTHMMQQAIIALPKSEDCRRRCCRVKQYTLLLWFPGQSLCEHTSRTTPEEGAHGPSSWPNRLIIIIVIIIWLEYIFFGLSYIGSTVIDCKQRHSRILW